MRLHMFVAFAKPFVWERVPRRRKKGELNDNNNRAGIISDNYYYYGHFKLNRNIEHKYCWADAHSLHPLTSVGRISRNFRLCDIQTGAVARQSASETEQKRFGAIVWKFNLRMVIHLMCFSEHKLAFGRSVVRSLARYLVGSVERSPVSSFALLSNDRQFGHQFLNWSAFNLWRAIKLKTNERGAFVFIEFDCFLAIRSYLLLSRFHSLSSSSRDSCVQLFYWFFSEFFSVSISPADLLISDHLVLTIRPTISAACNIWYSLYVYESQTHQLSLINNNNFPLVATGATERAAEKSVQFVLLLFFVRSFFIFV